MHIFVFCVHSARSLTESGDHMVQKLIIVLFLFLSAQLFAQDGADLFFQNPYLENEGHNYVTISTEIELTVEHCLVNADTLSWRVGVSYYYSSLPEPTSEAVLLGEDHSSLGNGVDYEMESAYLQIPENALLGVGYILIVSDQNGIYSHLEQNLENNTFPLPIWVNEENNVNVAQQDIEGIDTSVFVYPNPVGSGNQLNIELIANKNHRSSNNSAFAVTMVNIKGQVVDKYYGSSGQMVASLDVSHLSSGTYFLRVSDGNTFTNKKVVLVK